MPPRLPRLLERIAVAQAAEITEITIPKGAAKIRKRGQEAEKIKIRCSLSEDCDEKGAGGLWDLSAKIAFNVAISRGAKPGEIDVEEWGQDAIYNVLCDLAEREAENDT